MCVGGSRGTARGACMASACPRQVHACVYVCVCVCVLGAHQASEQPWPLGLEKGEAQQTQLKGRSRQRRVSKAADPVAPSWEPLALVAADTPVFHHYDFG